MDSAKEKTKRIKNPLNKREKAVLVEKCDKLVSFVDTVGHEPWLRTTIRGIVGQKLSHGLLVVAAEQGPTHITREHLGHHIGHGIAGDSGDNQN